MLLLVLEKIHGLLATLAVALCLHPPIALRKARRPSNATRWAAGIASLLVLACNAMGWWIYPAYREEVKLPLYREARFYGLMFETKEHIAWFALALAVAGGVMAIAAGGKRGIVLRRPIMQVYTMLCVCTLAVAVMGMLIASVNGFAYPLP